MANKDYFRGQRWEPAQLETEIILKGLPLRVEYTYYPGCDATEDEPPVYDDVEVEAVWIDEFDIINLIGDKTLTSIIEKLFDVIDKGKNE